MHTSFYNVSINLRSGVISHRISQTFCLSQKCIEQLSRNHGRTFYLTSYIKNDAEFSTCQLERFAFSIRTN